MVFAGSNVNACAGRANRQFDVDDQAVRRSRRSMDLMRHPADEEVLPANP